MTDIEQKAWELAAKNMDWQQVVLNGGPPCFHLEGTNFCGRAQRWDGHPLVHRFISLAAAIQAVVDEEREEYAASRFRPRPSAGEGSCAYHAFSRRVHLENGFDKILPRKALTFFKSCTMPTLQRNAKQHLACNQEGVYQKMALVYSIEDAAKMLSISHWTVRAWLRDGRLRSARVGDRRMIRAEELERVIVDEPPKRVANQQKI